jgi:hypothetical protein
MARAKKTKADVPSVPAKAKTAREAEQAAVREVVEKTLRNAAQRAVPNDRTTSAGVGSSDAKIAKATTIGTMEDEAAIENTWKESGNLRIVADRIGLGLLRGEVSPALAWVHKVLLELATASVDMKSYAKQARSLVRYIAVREAHDRDGYSWDDAPIRAAEVLRGAPAQASSGWMWKEYCKVRKAFRDAGAVRDDDDPGYEWVDPSDKS